MKTVIKHTSKTHQTPLIIYKLKEGCSQKIFVPIKAFMLYIDSSWHAVIYTILILQRPLGAFKCDTITQRGSYTFSNLFSHCAEYFLTLFAQFFRCVIKHVSHITWSIGHAVYTPLIDRTSQFYFQKMWNYNELAIIWINPGSICRNYYCLLFCKWDGS